MCNECKYGKECSNGIICENPQSENFDNLMDYGDTCIKHRKIKIVKKKEVEPVVIEEHIANPIIEKPPEEPKQEEPKKEPKKEKNYTTKDVKINDEIYVIVRDDHIAGFESCVNEFGGKHIFYHEEGLAREHCEKISNKKIKYKYIKCKIEGY